MMGGGPKKVEVYQSPTPRPCYWVTIASAFRCVVLSVARILFVYIGAPFRGITLYAPTDLSYMLVSNEDKRCWVSTLKCTRKGATAYHEFPRTRYISLSVHFQP